jgi:hypothetical protein
VASSDIEHRSVSVADHPVTQHNRKGSQCGISQVDVQAIVEQTVQECMRNMQSQTAAPQVYASRVVYPIPLAREVPATAAARQYKPLEELANPRYDLSMSHGAHTSWLNRELRLPKFKGYADENPLDFLTKFERFAAALSHLNLDQACRQCMPLALTDEAEQWMIAESKRWPLDYSYKEFSQALVDRFLPHDYVDRMRRFLETRMQGENETLARFITVIETAYARMGVKSSEREVIRRISTQLNPTYNQLIGHRYFGSIHEISTHARAIDAQVHRQKSFKVVKADCPDADLNVLNYPPKTPNESSQAQLVGREDNQRSSRTGGADGSWNEFKDHVDSKSEINTEYSNGEEIPKLKVCYLCGEPSHLANKCPMRGDSVKGKHGVGGEDTGKRVTRVFATRVSSGKRGTHLGKLRKRCKAMEPRIQVWSAAIPVNAMLDDGADVSILDFHCASSVLGLKIESSNTKSIQFIQGKAEVEGECWIELIYPGGRCSVKALVLRDAGEDLLLGRDFLLLANIDCRLNQKGWCFSNQPNAIYPFAPRPSRSNHIRCNFVASKQTVTQGMALSSKVLMRKQHNQVVENRQWKWQEVDLAPCAALRQALSSQKVLMLPPLFFRTDVNGSGLEEVLVQEKAEGLRPTRFESLTQLPAEKNCVESLAINCTMNKIRQYAERVEVVETDHKALQCMVSLEQPFCMMQWPLLQTLIRHPMDQGLIVDDPLSSAPRKSGRILEWSCMNKGGVPAEDPVLVPNLDGSDRERLEHCSDTAPSEVTSAVVARQMGKEARELPSQRMTLGASDNVQTDGLAGQHPSRSVRNHRRRRQPP